METYFDSYFKRMSLVHTELNELGKSLKQLGCEVFVPKNGLIKFIKVFKDDKHLIVGFSEVPYHWYLQICYKPSKENGSGKTIKTKYSSCYDMVDVLDNLHPNPNTKDFTNPSYLKPLI